MPFLPPNQQRQSTEGTKTPGNTIQNTCIHCTEIKRWIQLNIKRNKMCRCRVMTIFYEHKTFFVSNFETTVHAISLNIVWSKLSEIVRWLYEYAMRVKANGVWMHCTAAYFWVGRRGHASPEPDADTGIPVPERNEASRFAADVVLVCCYYFATLWLVCPYVCSFAYVKTPAIIIINIATGHY